MKTLSRPKPNVIIDNVITDVVNQIHTMYNLLTHMYSIQMGEEY